ncbi:MAG: tRNA isopentenyl-2-thiomethyl-A-37 hydroxylase MiaE [Acidobacteriota bacterium]
MSTRAYVKLAQVLLDEGTYPALATHDERMIEAILAHVRERSIAAERFEFEMLHGVRRDLQRDLGEARISRAGLCSVRGAMVSLLYAPPRRASGERVVPGEESVAVAMEAGLPSFAFSNAHGGGVTRCLQDPVALLIDHAFLERKAANNALELMTKWPGNEVAVDMMTAVARDEAAHLSQVTRLLTRRGGKLERVHKNPYANELRQLVRKGENGEVLDRLFVSALIEARSCERFSVLGGCF